MKVIITHIFIFFTCLSIAQPANDNCASATNLTVDNPLLCNQAAGPATAQAGECLTSWAGAGNATMWYSFTATNDSTVLNSIATAGSGYFLRVFGPAPACQPSCASAVYSAQQTGDPGEHILITGLVPGQVYYIQIDAADPNGPGQSALVLCINVNNPVAAGLSSGALLLDACGTAFSNSTNNGAWQSGSGLSFANFDGVAGDDMPFVGNNTSWSTFCSLTNGTWQITVSGVTNCTLSAPNQGVQGSVFTGTTADLNNMGNSQNPIPPGGSWTSPVITVNAGECAYLAIDGFAGDACDYTVTLTNLTGGCIVLPVEMLSFVASISDEAVQLKWVTATEQNNDYFVLEKSQDGSIFSFVDVIDGAGNSNQQLTYSYEDVHQFSGTFYYRLRQVDYDGNSRISAMAKIVRQESVFTDLVISPNPIDSDQYPTLLLSGIEGDTYDVILTDISGKILSSEKFTLEHDGNFQHTLSANVAKGIYLVTVIDQYQKSISRKLVVE